MTLVLCVLRVAHNVNQADDTQAVADMICIAFCFLLRPGECTGTATDDQPFLIKNVTLHLGNQQLDLCHDPVNQILAAMSVTHTFATQKNANRNEQVSNSCSKHPLCCPVKATMRRVLCHRRMNTPRNKPLASHCNERNQRVAIQPADATDKLRAAARANFHATGIHATDISAFSLRAGGAMALLCGNVHFNVVKLLG